MGVDWNLWYVLRALEHLGKALHPVQDWVAHGTWDPTWMPWPLPNWRIHPDGTDDWRKDFRHAPDGILRDYERDLGEKKPDPQFVAGLQRIKRTEQLTLLYLNRFKQALDEGGYCYCRLYRWRRR